MMVNELMWKHWRCPHCSNKLDELEKDKKQLLEALRNLHDEQNGPPLLKYEKDWRAAMDRAKWLLKELEGGGE